MIEKKQKGNPERDFYHSSTTLANSFFYSLIEVFFQDMKITGGDLDPFA
tara:strand:+ start:414 stop:560 length:147 start_codon:yes stop_codon:yes gene_type:complete